MGFNAFGRDLFRFEELFVCDMANNHQGSVERGLRIIDACGQVFKNAGVRGAVKLQFRNLDTFIHPAFCNAEEPKHIRRFLSTQLTEEQFRALVEATKNAGLVSMATPFDEDSVDMLERLDVDVLKIGSCSATDMPLLVRASRTYKPIICSTGGLALADIDRLVSFLHHRGAHFALMHCVSLYPTLDEDLQLNQIELLRHRYRDVPIGFSTHESPENMDAIKIAYAKGARLFERHVGIATDAVTLNAYSSMPAQIARWIAEWKKAAQMCGAKNRPPASTAETEAIRSLMRGVYARRNIPAHAALQPEDVFFAMPLQKGQLSAADWKGENALVADRDYREKEPISEKINPSTPTLKELVYPIIHEVKGVLNNAGVVVGHDADVELSHHYGLTRLREVGAVLIECVSTAQYCEKIVVQLSGQWHPYHYHKKKDETFRVLWGRLEVEVEGNPRVLFPGDTIQIKRGIRHKFKGADGRAVVFEEISTADMPNDSIYEDSAINRLERQDRKTKLQNWGRFQFD